MSKPSYSYTTQTYKKRSNNEDKKIKKSKISFGIICFYFDIYDKCYKVLLVKRKFSYGFSEFVLSNRAGKDKNALLKLLNDMTIEEKSAIYTLDFEFIWKYAGMKIPDLTNNQYSSHIIKKNKIPGVNTDALNSYYYNKMKVEINHYESYHKRKKYFENLYLQDKGIFLQNLIQESKDGGLIWEIPKGRKGNNEADVNCAVREFEEETSIKSKDYRILFDIKKINVTNIIDSVLYINNYFVAYCDKYIKPSIDYSKREQVSEICDIKWVSLQELKLIDSSHALYNFIKPILSQVKKRISKVNFYKKHTDIYRE